jgi:hypothetical protein
MSPAIPTMTDAHDARQRLHDLLADRATCGLSLTETLELDALAAEHPDVDLDVVDRIAAELVLALGDDARVPPIPASLTNRLQKSMQRHQARRTGGSMRGITSPPSAPGSTPSYRADSRVAGSAASPWRAMIPWITAAAAVIIAAVALTMRGAPAEGGGTSSPWMLAERAADALRLPLSANDLGVTGEIVWSTHTQSGFVRLSGLQRNDPQRMQYQLWIFDAQRSARGEEMNAVDGGVFDIPETDDIIVPITPAIRVFDPALFAITSEPPGGVVRHDPQLDPQRYRILVTSAAQSS